MGKTIAEKILERMAICNMLVEAGAKTGMVEPDEITAAWAKQVCKRDYVLLQADAVAGEIIDPAKL